MTLKMALGSSGGTTCGVGEDKEEGEEGEVAEAEAEAGLRLKGEKRDAKKPIFLFDGPEGLLVMLVCGRGDL